MVQHAEAHIAEEFKRVFSELYKDKIQKLIHESREEAFVQAKEILKDRALNSVLTIAIGDNSERNQDASTSLPPSLKKDIHTEQPSNINTGEKTPHKPALSDRILEEIEAIREQILRNEELLSQIKPLIGLPKNSPENT